MRVISWTLLAFSLLVAQSAFAEDASKLLRKASRYFEPLPSIMPGADKDTPEKIALGKKLFFDKRLSINDTQSCASCHRLEGRFAGADSLPNSPGAKGKLGTRNTPTVLNAGWQFSQFWDGRSPDLTEQAKQPILNPIEMGMPDELAVVGKLKGIDEYQKMFAAAFPDVAEPLTYHNMAESIAAFERTLRSESRFDDFMNGDTTALTRQELKGLDTYLSLGCAKCHDGALLGGGLFERLEQYGTYTNQKDLGRYEVTKDESDRMVFKVPQLRNVLLTAPYFHDGGIATLEEAIQLMVRLVLDRKVSDQQVSEVVSFLGSLTDKELEKSNR